MALSNLQRIKLVLDYYYKRGNNRELVNKVYHKIIKQKYENRN